MKDSAPGKDDNYIFAVEDPERLHSSFIQTWVMMPDSVLFAPHPPRLHHERFISFIGLHNFNVSAGDISGWNKKTSRVRFRWNDESFGTLMRLKGKDYPTPKLATGSVSGFIRLLGRTQGQALRIHLNDVLSMLNRNNAAFKETSGETTPRRSRDAMYIVMDAYDALDETEFAYMKNLIDASGLPLMLDALRAKTGITKP